MNNRIKELANKKKISYIVIAKELNVTNKTITNWTTGKRSLSLDSLNNISSVLGCEVNELIDCGSNYTHAYSPEGEWLGIIKK